MSLQWREDCETTAQHRSGVLKTGPLVSMASFLEKVQIAHLVFETVWNGENELLVRSNTCTVSTVCDLASVWVLAVVCVYHALAVVLVV